ncbi:hypothetical protein ES703_102977 [subsurface metagenome]
MAPIVAEALPVIAPKIATNATTAPPKAALALPKRTCMKRKSLADNPLDCITLPTMIYKGSAKKAHPCIIFREDGTSRFIQSIFPLVNIKIIQAMPKI